MGLQNSLSDWNNINRDKQTALHVKSGDLPWRRQRPGEDWRAASLEAADVLCPNPWAPAWELSACKNFQKYTEHMCTSLNIGYTLIKSLKKKLMLPNGLNSMNMQ